MFLVNNNRQEEAMKIIKKIWPGETKLNQQNIWNEKRQQAERQSDFEGRIGCGTVLCNRDYRGATWMGLFLAFAAQASGIDIINIYCRKLFEDIEN